MNPSSLIIDSALTRTRVEPQSGGRVASRGHHRATPAPAILAAQAQAWIRHRDAARSLPADQMVGRVVRFVVADGTATYRIASLSPLKLEHLADCGGYQLPDSVLRGLRIDDVLSRVERDQQRFDRYRTHD